MQREVAIYEYIVYCIVFGSALNLSFNAAKCVHAQIYTSVTDITRILRPQQSTLAQMVGTA